MSCVKCENYRRRYIVMSGVQQYGGGGVQPQAPHSVLKINTKQTFQDPN